MNVVIGSDHRGVDWKARIRGQLTALGHSVEDGGTRSTDSCDYPDIAHHVAAKVAAGEAERGILICGSGIGMSIAANKTLAVRAALCHDLHAAEMSRRHNDANILCLSADQLDTRTAEQVQAIIQTWMTTEFEGGRHQRRVEKISSGVKSTCHE